MITLGNIISKLWEWIIDDSKEKNLSFLIPLGAKYEVEKTYPTLGRS